MKILYGFTFSLLAFFFFGCATTVEKNRLLDQKISDPTKSEIVSGAWKAGGIMLDKAIFRRVDDKQYKTYKINKIYQIEPGLRSIDLHYVGSSGSKLNPRYCTALVTIDFIFEPNRRYLAFGSREGNTVELWIEDATTRERLSKVYSMRVNWPQLLKEY